MIWNEEHLALTPGWSSSTIRNKDLLISLLQELVKYAEERASAATMFKLRWVGMSVLELSQNETEDSEYCIRGVAGTF